MESVWLEKWNMIQTSAIAWTNRFCRVLMRCLKAVPLTQSQDFPSSKKCKDRQIKHLQHIHGRTDKMQTSTAAKTLAMHFQSRPSRSRIAHEGARFFWTPVHAQAVCDTIWAEGQGLNTYQIRPNWKQDWQCSLGDSCWSLVIFSDLWWSWMILDDAWFLFHWHFWLSNAAMHLNSLSHHEFSGHAPSQAGGVKQAFSSCPQSTGHPSFFGRQSNVPRFKAQDVSTQGRTGERIKVRCSNVLRILPWIIWGKQHWKKYDTRNHT